MSSVKSVAIYFFATDYADYTEFYTPLRLPVARLDALGIKSKASAARTFKVVQALS